MAIRTLQTNFTGGELSPLLDMRVDFQKYGNGADRLHNMLVRTTGGASRRAGAFFVSEVKDSTKRTWLKDFIFSQNDAFVLEMSNLAFRFYKDRAIVLGQGTGSELVSNGAFPANLNGWTVTNVGTGTTIWAANAAQLAGGAAGSTRLSQGIATTVDAVYIFTFDVLTTKLQVRVGTADGLGDVYSLTTHSAGSHIVRFTATSTTTYIQFYLDTNTTSDLDNVSVKLGSPLVVTTPYLEAEIPELRFSQVADVLYITHTSHPPMKLIRVQDFEWELRVVNFIPPATKVWPRYPAGTLTPGATTGNGVTFTASIAYFLAGDKGSVIQIGVGRGVIASVTDTTHVVVNITDAFSNTSPAGEGRWSITGSPYAKLDPDIMAPIHAVITLTADANAFRSDDVGKYIYIWGGIVQVTKYTSATVVEGEILSELAFDTAALEGTWSLEEASWSSAHGYPGVVTFFEQRVVYAGTPAQPTTFWGSRSGDFENFGRGANDDDSFEYTLGSGRVNLIRWMAPLKQLLIGTIGQEFKATGGTDAPITPTNILVTPETAYGCDITTDAISVGYAALFPQRCARQLREMSYSWEADSYRSPELSILAEHLFQSGIVQLARTSTPMSHLFAPVGSGLMPVCTYERSENVIAWSRFVTGPAQDLTDGWYESVTVIPGFCGCDDEVWVVAKRIINGQTKRYVELFDGQVYTDSALVYDSTPIDTVVGLEHLEGELVQVIADGTYYTATVTGGEITLNAPASYVEVGLSFGAGIRTLRLEVPTQSGPLQGRINRIGEEIVRFYCCGPGIVIEYGDAHNAQTYTPTVGARSEDKLIKRIGYDRLGLVTVVQTQPFDMTILGFMYGVTVDDG